MSAEIVRPGIIPLATEEDTHRKLSKQVKRAADRIALDRNYQLMDSSSRRSSPTTLTRLEKKKPNKYAHSVRLRHATFPRIVFCLERCSAPHGWLRRRVTLAGAFFQPTGALNRGNGTSALGISAER